MFAYARDVDDSSGRAAGIPVDWFEGDGVAIRGLHTPQGELGYSLRRDGDALVREVAGGIDVPAGGLVLPWPYAGEPGGATIDGGRKSVVKGQSVAVRVDLGGRRIIQKYSI